MEGDPAKLRLRSRPRRPRWDVDGPTQDHRIRFLSAAEYRAARHAWEHVKAAASQPARGPAAVSDDTHLHRDDLIALARAIAAYEGTPRGPWRLWRRLTDSPEAMPLSELLERYPRLRARLDG